jgi:hypothetical protein
MKAEQKNIDGQKDTKTISKLKDLFINKDKKLFEVTDEQSIRNRLYVRSLALKIKQSL